jgi:hypothetical protein
MTKPKIVAILDTMWDDRQMTSRAGYREACRSFRINPQNHSGRRLYRIVGSDADLHVTNACRELGTSANHHGKPDPDWLRENLERLMPFDVLLVCGKVAQATYARTGFEFARVIEMPHPAARMWTYAMIDAAAAQVRV